MRRSTSIFWGAALWIFLGTPAVVVLLTRFVDWDPVVVGNVWFWTGVIVGGYRLD